jgi:predicted aldo/keto reductase-like oxidoreductase
MLYRRFGRLNWSASALGFGAMRLPIIGGDAANVDQEQAIRMIRYSIDHGVNYIDTAYVYHQGRSETTVGKALQNGYRNKVRLATKMPTWKIESQEDMDKFFSEQLSRLQMDYVDFYLLHGLYSEAWHKLKNLKVQKWLEKNVAEGKIRHLGFSFHDEYPVFRKIIDDYDGWDFCQIQYNYFDENYQAGTRGLKYAASKGLAIVVMEPIAGGKLAMKPPETIQALWEKMKISRSPADWALRWVWSHPEVSVVLSGMSTMNQVVENVVSATYSQPDSLTKKQLSIFNQVRRKYEKLGFVSCSGCRYCMPCPQGVNIPELLSLHNEYYVRNRAEDVKSKYQKQIPPENRATKCVQCGRCEEICPQKVPIRELLSEVAFVLERE